MTPPLDGWLLTWASTLESRRGAVLTLILLLLVAGGWVSTVMPVQLLPRIDYPQIRVIADLPGQSAERIEGALNAPLEEALAGVRGVRAMQSRSGDERSYIDLFFVDGNDLQRAQADVGAAVQQAAASLPPEVPPPRVFSVSTADEPALVIAVAEGERTPWELRERLRAELIPSLRSIDGVAALHLGRTEEQELVVDVDPHTLALSGVSSNALLDVLRGAVMPPVNATARDVGLEALARHGALVPTRDRFLNLPLPADDGVPLRLEDVGSIAEGISEARLFSRLDGRDAVLLEVTRDPSARSDRVARDVRETVWAWASASDERVAVFLHDDAFLTEAAIRGVLSAALAGGLLATLLLLLALRHARHLPVILLLLPGTFALALLLIHAAGHSLNLMTLTGLLFSVGLGLDYVIIHADRVDREQGKPAGSSPSSDSPAHRAFAAIAGPLLGALLTTVAAVAPFLLVQGAVAQLFAPMIHSVLAASVASFALAMVVLPAWAGGRLVPAESASPQVVPQKTRGGDRPLALRIVGGVILVVAPLLLAWWSLVLPVELLPAVDDGLVRVRVNVPADQPLHEVDRTARAVQDALAAVAGTEHIHVTVGGYVREGSPGYRPGEINLLVRVAPEPQGPGSERWVRVAREAVADMDLPHTGTRWELPRIRGIRTSLADDDVVLVLSHSEGDMRVLQKEGARLVERLGDVPGIGSFRPSRDGFGTRLVVEEDARALQDAGVSASELRSVVGLGLEGWVVQRWMHAGERRALRVRFVRPAAGRSTTLDRLPVLGVDGAVVSVGALTRQHWREEALHIERDAGLRVVRLQASRDGTASAGASLDALRAALESAPLPVEVNMRVDGELASTARIFRSLLGALALCILGVLLVLHLQYGRLRSAAAAVVMLPLSATGALALTALSGLPLGGLLLAGLLIAFGIIANGAILILSEAVELAKDARLMQHHVVEAAGNRLRPIVLTVLTTSLGLSPLVFAGGAVSELLRPLALAVLGALVLSIAMLHLCLPLLFLRRPSSEA